MARIVLHEPYEPSAQVTTEFLERRGHQVILLASLDLLQQVVVKERIQFGIFSYGAAGQWVRPIVEIVLPARLPFVIYTGQGCIELPDEVASACLGIFTKPAKFDDLSALINRVVGGRAAS